MKRVLIDTSAWIEYFRENEFSLADQVSSLVLEERVVLCGVVEYELFRGAHKEERADLEARLNELEYIEFERRDHRLAASLFKKMRSVGKTLHYTDLLIAAFCIARGLILLTLDRDFDGIPGLQRLSPNRT